MNDCPKISKPIVEWLKEMWPEKSPERSWDINETQYRAGQASVVRRIILEYENQIEGNYVSTKIKQDG